MAVSAFIFEGTDLNFDQLVLENSRKGLVLVDFWAPDGLRSRACPP